jgi:hypothetical protein
VLRFGADLRGVRVFYCVRDLAEELALRPLGLVLEGAIATWLGGSPR